MLTKTWTDILEISQRCPSPHNVQPWKVKIESDSTCTVYLDDARTLPKEDTTGSFINSGMVMYLEMMRLAAETQRYSLEYTILANQTTNQDNLIPFATVKITYDKGIVPTYSQETLLQRRTSRLGQLSTPVPTDVQRALKDLAISHGHQYGHTEQHDLIEQILARNIAALFEDMNRANYHDEIVSWFRFSDRKSRQHADGLDARCMRMSKPEYFISAKMPSIFKVPVLRNILSNRYRTILGPTHCIGWLSGKFWGTKDANEAGKLLLRFWLDLTQAGLYIHPFGNLVTNKEANQWAEDAIKTDNVWFIFRIGYTEQPPESYRIPVQGILL